MTDLFQFNYQIIDRLIGYERISQIVLLIKQFEIRSVVTKFVRFSFETDFSVVFSILSTGFEGFKELSLKINALPPLQVKWTDRRLIQSNDMV